MWLGRYRRRTVVVDSGEQRNLGAEHAHGYLTADGSAPGELLRRARGDVRRYGTVELIDGRVTGIRRNEDRFIVTTSEGAFDSARVVLATGVADTVPDLPGFSELYGRHIFHCSCCDGFESHDMDVVAIGWGAHSAGYALDLLDWGARVTLVTNGNSFEGDRAARAALSRHEIELIEDEVVGMGTAGDELTSVILKSGRKLPAQRAFFSIGHEPRTDLATSIGCDIDELGYLTVDRHGETTISGMYAAGDVTPGEQLVQVAASEGAIAGIACAMSMRGEVTAPGVPKSGPDPSEELG